MPDVSAGSRWWPVSAIGHISLCRFVKVMTDHMRASDPQEGRMKSRMKNVAMVMPDALRALVAFSKTAENGLVPAKTIQLVQLRASQINGCSVCVDMHYRALTEAGETAERCVTVSAWRDTPYFSDAERAALALAEVVTRLSDRPEPVPDDIWNEAARHYDERALAALLVAIGAINVWNRLNVATKQVAFGRNPEAAAS
jgi:AhpD family alkylhydroperoxidase